MALLVDSTKYFKKKNSFYKLFQKIEREGTLLISFYMKLLPWEQMQSKTLQEKKILPNIFMNIDAKFLNKILANWIQ